MSSTLTTATSVRNLVQGSRNRLRLDVLRFPLEIDETPHKMIFKFYSNSQQNRGTGHSLSRASDMFLVLPVPQKIMDGVGIKYTAVDLGLSGELLSGMTNVVSGISFGSMGELFTSSVTAGSRILSGIRNIAAGGSDLARDLGSAGAQYIGGAVLNRALSSIGVSNPQAAQALAAGTGRIINPFTTAIFEGVSVRTFSFSWIFSPDGPAQSVALEKIIKRLRAKSLPALSASKLFMNFPPEVEFNFLGMQKDTFDFPVAPCVVTKLEVDRTASGKPVFFAGTGAPVFTSITLQLMEIRPLVAKGDEGDNVITNASISNALEVTSALPSNNVRRNERAGGT